MKYLKFFPVLIIFMVTGCSPIIDESTRNAIIEKDPHFKEVLDKKTVLDAQITDLKSKLREKTEEINTKVNALRDEMRFYQSETNKRIVELKSELNSEREAISGRISLIKGELDSKIKNLKTLKNTKRNIEKLIKKNKDIEFSKSNVDKWEIEVSEANDKIIPLEEDIKVLKNTITFLKLKLAALRQ